MNFIVKKPITLSWISTKSWDSLDLKEKDFMIFLHSRKYTKHIIMRKLYITSRVGYWMLQKKVQEKLKDDVNRINQLNTKALNKTKSN